MKFEYNYTVIIPHHNIPNLLQRCLDSIPRRDDIQIIVVDDNSDPVKVNFNSFPGLDDPYVEVVFTKEGRGAGYARNVGLDRAEGKWILFADADDFYEINKFKKLDQKIDSKADIIYFLINVCDSVSGESVHSFDSINKNILEYDNNDLNSGLLRCLNWEPWNKMISRGYINDHSLRFDETKVANDAYFIVKAGLEASNVDVLKEVLYVYNIRDFSLSNLLSFELECLRLRVCVRINNIIRMSHWRQYRILPSSKLYLIYKNYGLGALCKSFCLILNESNSLYFVVLSFLGFIRLYIMKIFWQ